MTALGYRRGTYSSFLGDMLGALQTQQVQGAGAEPPLAGIHLTSTDDLVIGILRVWASAGDVLTFYQERIANEGYLRTATESASIVELAHTIGYQPAPPLAALTYLAFSVGGGVGIPNQLTVPIGTRVQSVPGPGGRPQVFETVEALPMLAEWSDMTPAPAQPGDPPPIQTGSTDVMLNGINLHLTPGDLLLMVDENTYQPPIKHLVWGTELPVFVHGRYRPITAVEPDRAQQRTRVRWDTPIDGPNLARPAAFVFRKQAHVFGYDAADWNSLPQQRKTDLAPPVGGLFHSTDAGNQWIAASGSTTTRAVRALQCDAAGHVFAATAGDGVLRSDDGGANWRQVNTLLVRKDVHALAVDASGGLYAGSSGGGVMRSLDGGESWAPLRTENNLQLGRQGFSVATTRLPNTVVRALAVTGSTVLAATDSGLFRATLGGNGWEAASGGLSPSTQLTALLAINNGPVILGTNQGAFVSTNQGSGWSSASTGLPPGTSVTALTSLGGSVFAISDQGVFVSPTQAQLRWTPANAPTGALLSLAASSDTLFVGTSAGVFRSTDSAATWQPIATGLTAASVPALAVSADGSQMVAAQPLSASTGNQWPGFELAQDSLDLDTTYPAVQTGGWFLVTQPGGQAGLFPVLQAQRTSRTQFGQRGFITTITTHPDPQLPTFDRRTALVHVASDPLTLAVDPLSVLHEPTVTLSSVLAESLVNGRAVALTGKRPYGRLAPTLPPETRLISENGRESVPLEARELVEVLTAPTSTPDGSLTWRLRHHSGLVGSVTLQPDQLVWVAADANSELVSEIMWVAECKADDGTGHAQVSFTEPPGNVYDAATVHLNGNVALATHGESVQEVLGSGDATQSRQEFTLNRQPVTRYILPGQVEQTSTLRIFVNRVAWEPTQALMKVDAHSHAYSTQTDEAGTVHVMFGDGIRGARLPTGTENVVATYRTGAGPDGEVRAGSLAQLMTRPLGVRSVTNPVAASGAAPAESAELIRARAPHSLVQRDRIVSLSDYAVFAAGRPDVLRAVVRRLHLRNRPLIHVTVAVMPGAVLDTNGLATAIRAAQATPADVQVDVSLTVAFAATVRVVLDPAQLAQNPADEVRTRLLDAFSLVNRELAQPVAASDLVRVAQAVPGIKAVDLVALDYSGATPLKVQPRLVAAAAHLGQATGQIRAAEVLVLDPDHLTVELG